MKKNGFTLAEVLITLGIIGVIAALTTPALVKDTGTAKIGPSLSKFVNTFETACEQYMYDEGVSRFNGSNFYDLTTSVSAGFLQKLSKYMIMVELPVKSGDVKYTVNKQNGTEYRTADGEQFHLFQLKDGSVMMTDYNPTSGVTPAGAYLGHIPGLILYDINGIKGNNTVGKEVFAFEVDKSGILVPFGSNAYSSLHNKVKYECDLSSPDVTKGFACTGKIADNNWSAKGVY